MNPVLADLLQVLQLERLEINLFRGVSRDLGFPQVFGGQVLGQALAAASATINAKPGESLRYAHSLHAYFLLPGDVRAPIIYEVDRSRDGGNFSSRRVVAIQHGQQIFHMSASFQTEQSGLDHQLDMPQVPGPETLPDIRELVAKSNDIPPELKGWFSVPLPIEFRAVNPEELMSAHPSRPSTQFWFRAVDALPDDAVLHRSVLAYASDFYLLRTATQPHGIPFPSAKLRLATIDHAMWFHRPLRVDDWLLYSIDSPSASGSRGLSRGSIFNRQGQLVASVAQEGLVRVRT
ncbi:MAG: acyl-CoA thioesterase II [Steroidobacteraceae bacterium]